MSGNVVKSAARVFEVLELFSALQRPLSVREISTRCGYPGSSAAALLTSMKALGYLAYDDATHTYARLRGSSISAKRSSIRRRQPAVLACRRKAVGGPHARGRRDRGAERPVRAVHRCGRGRAYASDPLLRADRHASRDLHVEPRLGVAEPPAGQRDPPARVAQHPPARQVGPDDRRDVVLDGRTDAPVRLFLFGAHGHAGRRDDLDGDRGRLERPAAGHGVAGPVERIDAQRDAIVRAMREVLAGQGPDAAAG